jgi:hypothetical protein
VSQAPDIGDIAIVGHGGTGTLLYCHSRDCRSAGSAINHRQMVGTGSPLIRRAGNSCTPDGTRSMPRHSRAPGDHDGLVAGLVARAQGTSLLGRDWRVTSRALQPVEPSRARMPLQQVILGYRSQRLCCANRTRPDRY